MAGETVEEPEQADAIAFLAAHVRGDERACQELLGALGTAGGIRLLSEVVSLAVGVACRSLPGGRAELLDMLTSWQERRRGQLLD
jgi:hypothetical protein